MALPIPRPGLVIRYAYLWRFEADQGRQEGIKDRPCAVILTVAKQAGLTTVVVAPITHRPPADATSAFELPIETKRRLALDPVPSWIVTSDLNVFTWPGPDIRLVDPKRPDLGFAYGYLPYKLTQHLIESVRSLLRERKAGTVNRD